jgi:tetratricopeptide (TPR) repeat protein
MKSRATLILLSSLFVVACTDPSGKIIQKISELEQGELTPEVYGELADAQSEYLNLGKKDSLSKVFEVSVVENYMLSGNYEKSIEKGEELLIKDSLRFDQIASMLAESYKNVERNVKALSVYKKLAQNRALTPTELSSLGNLELDYYEERPDSTRVENLFNGANAMMNVGNHTEAIKRFDQLVSKHPTSKYGPFAMMQLATIYDEVLKDAETAQEKYEELVAQYPESKFAQDAQIILDRGYIGKTNEELIRMFEQNQK